MKGNRKYYSLTESQKMLLYNQKFTLLKQVNNVFTLALVRERMDFNVLSRAVEYAYAHCDTLRIRFERNAGEVKQYFLEKETPRIRTLDFTGQTQERMDRTLYRLASRPFYVKRRQMSRFWLVRSCDSMSGIYLGVSHMILDSWGICVLMKYIMDVYDAMKQGADMAYTLYPTENVLEKDLEYRDSPQHQKDLEFWRKECERPEPHYTHINGSSVLERYRRKKKSPASRYAECITVFTQAKHEMLLVGKNEMDELKAFCARRNLPMQALFMLGVRTCLSQRCDRQGDVSYYTTVARRGTRQEKMSGGTRVLALHFRTLIPEDMPFYAAADAMRDRQNLIYRHAEFGVLEYIPLLQGAYCHNDPMVSHMSMTLTFQPLPLTFGEGRECRTKWYCNGAASQPLYLTVMDDDGSGALRCYYEYQTHVISRQTILDFHADLVRVMLSGARDPDITIGELLDGKATPLRPAAYTAPAAGLPAV